MRGIGGGDKFSVTKYHIWFQRPYLRDPQELVSDAARCR